MEFKTLKRWLLLASLCGVASAENIAYVPKAAPGTDGAGEEWPTPRFVVNGNCVTDNLTGLMWAKNANLFGQKVWRSGSDPNYTYPAQEAINAMNGSDPSATGYHLCAYSDWRLPNQKELLSLLNYATTSGNSKDWLTTQNFTSVQPRYWSSTTYDSSNVWYVQMSTSINSKQFMSGNAFVWPVRGGQ